MYLIFNKTQGEIIGINTFQFELCEKWGPNRPLWTRL